MDSDAGINYFDVAPTYANAEERLGPALKGKRNGVFLACKTEDRTRKGSQAEEELDTLRTIAHQTVPLFPLKAK